MTTVCEDCDHVHADTRKRSPTQWLCVKFKRAAGGSFVAPNVWTEHEPYLRCAAVNGGMCPFFTPRKDASFRETETGGIKITTGLK